MAKEGILDFFPPVGIPFTVEITLTAENADTAAKIMDTYMKGEDILPGVRISKVYRPVETPKTVASDMLLDGVEKEYKEFMLTVKAAAAKFLSTRRIVKTATNAKYEEMKQNGDNENEKWDKDDDDPGFHGAWCGLPV